MAFSIGDFTLLDWLVVAIVLYSIVMSTMRGFVRELLGLVTVVAALVLSAWFHNDLAVIFEDVVRTENLALFLGFSLLFVGTLAVGFTLIWLTYRVFKIAHIEWFDRVLGGAFGFVRGWLIAAAIFVGLTSFEVRAESVRNSELAPYFLAGSRAVVAMTPFQLKARFLIGYEEVQRWWSDNSS
jgi:membrane protein required for colicin V production